MEKFERKVTKIGNSYGITLPADLLKEVGLIYGDQVQVEEKDGNILLSKKENITLPEGVDAEFLSILNEVITEHDEAFKGLVNR